MLWANFQSKQLGYVESRKKVYVPEYNKKLRTPESFRDLRRRVQQGEHVVVMDFSGPRTKEGGVACARVTADLLRDKVEDTTTPSGHVYVVAAGLAGIALSSFVD